MTISVISYGGGVQSTALLVLAAQEKIEYRTFLFANVGEDSEEPETLTYFHEVALPYARAHGIPLLELRKTRFGEPETLYEHLTRPLSKSIGIPVRMNGNGAPGNRSCTADFKIRVVDKHLKASAHAGLIAAMRKAFLLHFGLSCIEKKTLKGITQREIEAFFHLHPPVARVALGISLDEIGRMKPNMDTETIYWKVNDFPLLDLRMDRQDCLNVIEQAGLPRPPKSSCIFCPFHTQMRWQQMRTHRPDLFWKSVALERLLNERRATLGLDPVWFTRKLVPLDQATCEEEQLSLFSREEEDLCESGYCFV